MPDKKIDLNQPIKGLNKDVHPSNLDGQNAYIDAYNVRQESEDGGAMNITNESSNSKCLDFPEGLSVIGHKNIPEQGKTIYFLTDGITSEIGYISNDIESDCTLESDITDEIDPCDECNKKLSVEVRGEADIDTTKSCCTYVRILSSDCLGFSINHPIHEVEYEITNKTLKIYWTDNYNVMYWLDVNNIPYVKNSNGLLVDCNRLRVFPEFEIPIIQPIETYDSGSLKQGAYQFFIAYSNAKGEELSEYYSATNLTNIHDNIPTNRFGFDTSKSIKIRISDIDTSFDYFNIAVGKIIESAVSYELLGTFDITSPVFEYLYTGNNKIAKPLTSEDIFFRYPYYKRAGTVTTQDSLLMWGNLESYERLNYQKIANKVKLYWETWRVPYNKFEAYYNGVNCANIRGYMRDDVYAFSLVPITKSGRFLDAFPIPGRSAKGNDFEEINNEDSQNYLDNPCDDPGNVYRWQLYNTANILGFSDEYTESDCYVGPYEYGEFGYWESIYTYPNDPNVWGELAGLPIRHHKFPDNTLVPIHDNNPGGDMNYLHSIYPIGVKVDISTVIQAIKDSDLTQDQKDDIIGIKVIRGNRGGNNSVVAKGLVFNVGKYTRDEQTYYFSNYPLNDLGKDPFISSSKPLHRSGSNNGNTVNNDSYNNQYFPDIRLDAFADIDSKSRYTFMSPQTLFNRPNLTGSLKLESIEYGIAKAQLVKVQKNAKYTIGTRRGVKMAVALAMSTLLSYNGSMSASGVTLSLESFLPSFNSALDLIKKLIPFRDYGYQYNAVGNYCVSEQVQEGNRIRSIDLARYLEPGIFNIDDTYPVNNFQRESSVYLRLNGTFPFPHEVGGPVDNTRFTFNSYKAETGTDLVDNIKIDRNVSCYYASIKRNRPDQYGQIYSYETIDTGSTIKFTNTRPTTIFGGDTYINRFADKRKLPFFLQNGVGAQDDSDIFYNEFGNVGYPTYYLSTGPIQYEMSQNVKDKFDTAYDKATDTDLGTGILSAVTGGLTRFVPCMSAMVALVQDIVNFLGIKDINLDRHVDKGYFEEGTMYLFAYGIPYFFVESDVNVDMRQAANNTDKDFFPNVGTDIPEFWLQETNVSIINDNAHLYNPDFTRLNRANYFTHLPADYNPAEVNIIKHYTRVIYSEKTSLEANQNNWLVYKASNYYDFPLVNGTLIDLVGIEQSKVLARFENNISVYNAFIALPTDNKTAITGTGSMFNTPPQEFSKTDIGYAGTQHKAFVSTKYGHFWIDAKRGEVFQLQGQLKEISRAGIRNWMKENLPFKISKYYKDIPVDNSYKDVGISMSWDTRHERLFITKKDYVPLNKDIIYDKQTGEFILNDVSISPEDNRYFCNASWTIAYSPITESWVSYYSFIPDWYVAHSDFFQTGKNNSLWNHLHTNKSFCTFYGKHEPFYIEPITKTDLSSGVLGSVWFRLDVMRYTNSYDWKYMKDITFDSAQISSTTNTSGNIQLEVVDKNDMSSGLFSTIKEGYRIIPITSSDNIWRFNKFSDVTKDANSKQPLYLNECNNVLKEVNPLAVDYTKPDDMSRYTRLKSDWFKVKLINKVQSRFKFIFKWLLTKTTKSIR